MCYLTYNLKGGNENSNEYYEKVKTVKNQVINSLFNKSLIYISDFSNYITINSIENLRTDKEYFIEFLLIGVLKKEYDSFVDNINLQEEILLKLLNKYRNINIIKSFMDKFRGVMNTKILIKRKKKSPCNYDNINNLLRWLECSGDFQEELKRLYNWKKYLENKDKNFRKRFLASALDLAKEFENICENTLNIYVANVESYLSKYRVEHNNREDIIYCGKGKIQYFFNMVCSEIMNDVYRKSFLDAKHKIIFLPACMRQQDRKCMSRKCRNGYKCVGCSSLCNVNRLRRLGEIYNFYVRVIPHETDMNSIKNYDNNSYGIVGIACIINLVSGGFKALRLGFIPQCVLLEQVGCKNHWLLNKGNMTEINEERLLHILTKF